MGKLPLRMQDSLYHDMILPEETLGIRKKAREFAERKIAPKGYQLAHQEEKKENFPEDIFNALAQEDFFRIPFPKTVGGLGLKNPACATVVAIEELAYVSNSIAAMYDVQSILAGRALMQGNDFIKKKYLRPLVAGEKKVSFASTEPAASSDLSINSIQTKATKKGAKYILTGQKRFITNACVADYAAVLANTDGKLSMLVVDLDSEGCKVSKPDLKLGNRGMLTSEIYFDNVQMPVDNLIGEEGKGLYIALAALTYGRIGIAASGVGMAQSAFDESVDHMKRREVFGKKISQFQYWQFRFAERAIEIENARNLYSKAALRLDQGIEFPEPEASGAKYYSTNLAAEIAREAIQVHGGYGFMRELAHDKSTYKVEEIYRDCKIAEIYEGTSEIQKMIISRKIFGK